MSLSSAGLNNSDYLDTLFTGSRSASSLLHRNVAVVKLPSLDHDKNRSNTTKVTLNVLGKEVKVEKKKKKKSKRSASIKRFLYETAVIEEEETHKMTRSKSPAFRDTHQSLYESRESSSSSNIKTNNEHVGDLVIQFSRVCELREDFLRQLKQMVRKGIPLGIMVPKDRIKTKKRFLLLLTAIRKSTVKVVEMYQKARNAFESDYHPASSIVSLKRTLDSMRRYLTDMVDQGSQMAMDTLGQEPFVSWLGFALERNLFFIDRCIDGTSALRKSELPTDLIPADDEYERCMVCGSIVWESYMTEKKIQVTKEKSRGRKMPEVKGVTTIDREGENRSSSRSRSRSPSPTTERRTTNVRRYPAIDKDLVRRDHHDDDDGNDGEEEDDDDEFDVDMIVQPHNHRHPQNQRNSTTSSLSSNFHGKKQPHQDGQGSKSLSFISDFLDTVILHEEGGELADDDQGIFEEEDEEEEGMVRRRRRDLSLVSHTKDDRQHYHGNQEDGYASPTEDSLSPTSLDYPLHTLPTNTTPAPTSAATLPSPTLVISSWGLQDNLVQKSDTKRLDITMDEITACLTRAKCRYWMNRWQQALVQSRSITEMIAARNLNTKRKIFENLQDHQWRCSRFRNLQQRRLTQLVRKIYLAWSIHAKWCARFNLLHEAANSDWTKVFFDRWRGYAEICYATRHYRQTVKMIHKRCAFDCLRYNLKLNRFAIQHRITLQSTLSFFDRHYAPSLLFYRWRDNARKIKGLLHLDALALFFVVRKHFIVWRGEGKTKWMPKLLPGPAAAVFSGILNLSKSMNLSIGSSISAGAAAQAVGSAFSAAFGFMSSPGMKRRRVGDSKEGLGKGAAVASSGVSASTSGDSPQGTLPPKAGGGGIDTAGASVAVAGGSTAAAGISTEPAVAMPYASDAIAVTAHPADVHVGTGLAPSPSIGNNQPIPMQQAVVAGTPSAGTSSMDAKQALTEADRARRKRLLAAMGDDDES